MPKLFRFKRKKLRATAVRRPLRFAATAASYDEMSEPNMKLSRALLIVLLLHIVAIAGIIAFNALKTRQGPPLAIATAPATTTTTPAPAVSKPAGTNPIGLAAKLDAKPGGKEAAKTEHKADVENLPARSGKVYVVAKGDNPVAIARKFKVSYDDLLALNHIDDPRKLQIGQKLLIPAKPEKTKKSVD